MEEAELIVKFPWKRGNCFNCSFDLNQNARPGEYVLQTLFLEFCSVVERKIEQVLAEPLVCSNKLFHFLESFNLLDSLNSNI